MKKILLLTILMNILKLFAQNTIEFSSKTHDFGTISPNGGVVNFDFHFKNITDRPIIIKEILTSCGCTTPEWSKAPILPNKYGRVKVKFDPFNRMGPFTKSIKIITNIKNDFAMLKIEGDIVPDFIKSKMYIFPRPPYYSPSFNYMEPINSLFSGWNTLKKYSMTTYSAQPAQISLIL